MTNCVGKACSRRTQASERRARPLRHFVLIVCVVKACLPVSAAFSLPSVRSPLFTSTRRANLSDLRLFTTQNTGSSQRAASATTLFTKQNSTSSKLIPDFSQDVGLSTKDKVLVTIMIVAMLFSLGELMNVAGSGAWRYFLAGGICASTSHAITTPIDVVKTRKQVDSSLRNATFVQATSQIVRKEGIHSLTAGLGPTTVGYLLEGALKFGIYEVLKPAIGSFLAYVSRTTGIGFVDSKVIGFILSGTASGVAASAMLCPMEAIRIRQVAEPDFAPKGWVQAGLKMLKNEHMSGLWKGMTPMLYKQVPYTVTKNVSFDFLTTFSYILLRRAGFPINATTAFMVPLFSAFAASILSCISSQPGDMLLSLVNAHEGDKTANDFLKEISRSRRGMQRLFVGMKTRFLHVGIIVTVQLLIYDFVKRLVGIAATGSV